MYNCNQNNHIDSQTPHPSTPKWLHAASQANLTAAAWKLLAGLCDALLKHHDATGYPRMRLGRYTATHLCGGHPRTAQRAIQQLLDLGLIDRYDDRSGRGALTGVPLLELKRTRPAHRATPANNSAVQAGAPEMPYPFGPEGQKTEPAPSRQPPKQKRPSPTPPTTRDQAQWQRLTHALKSLLDPGDYESFIEPLVLNATTPNGQLILSAPNDLVADAAREILQRSQTSPSVQIRVGGATPPVRRPQPTSTATIAPPNRELSARDIRCAWRRFAKLYDTLETSTPPDELFAQLAYHVAYGSGSINHNYTTAQAFAGGIKLIERGDFRPPAHYARRYIAPYLQATADEISTPPGQIAA